MRSEVSSGPVHSRSSDGVWRAAHAVASSESGKAKRRARTGSGLPADEDRDAERVVGGVALGGDAGEVAGEDAVEDVGPEGEVPRPERCGEPLLHDEPLGDPGLAPPG